MNIRPWSTSPADYIAVNACLRPLAAVHEMDVSRINFIMHSNNMYLAAQYACGHFDANNENGPCKYCAFGSVPPKTR